MYLCDPLRLSFPAWLQVSTIPKFVCKTHVCAREMLPSNVGQLMWPHYPYGVWYLCIDTVTRTVFCDHTTRYTIYSGNWLHNSWRIAVSSWYIGSFLTHGGCECVICVHQAHDMCISAYICASDACACMGHTGGIR